MKKYNKEELEQLILVDKISYEEIGRRYDCTGSNIKKVAKKLGIDLPQRRKINENDLLINIEPYYLKSDKWDELNNILKLKRVNFWFRDDDVGFANEELKEMLCFFNKKSINFFGLKNKFNYY